MMKKLFALLLGLAVVPAFAQQETQPQYEVRIDLTKTSQDRLPVEILVPTVQQDTIEFHIPKIVPGTYSISDFGRFVNDFQAIDAEGNALNTQAIDANRIRITGAKQLHKITYKVDDTFDSELENPIFEPGGTNIEKGENYTLNTFGLVGYLEGMKEMPFEVMVTRPENFYGATALPFIRTEGNTDVFRSENYFHLADNPMMYNEPDTVSLEVGGAEVLVSVYSPNDIMTADFVMQNVKDVLMAQKEYLGGNLPVDKYAFLIYLSPSAMASGSWGALEHSYSSLYFLPEAKPEFLAQTIRDVAAHEFFHIVTPLNIHSEEIHYFDFIDPKMSEHLWLYEGITEYSAGHVQIKHDLINLEQYLDMITEKMQFAEKFNDTLPFTTMSKNCLDVYEDQYGNVYQKGALIGMCLDLKLRDLSDGEYGVQALIADLAKTYGKDRPFKDEELFAKIEELTYPEIGTFLKTYVDGSTPLPYKESLALAGIEYHESLVEKKASLGEISLGYNPETKRIYIAGLENANEFAEDMGYKVNDEFYSLNGIELDPSNFMEVIQEFQNTTEEGDRVKIEVMRKNKRGKVKKKKLRGRAILIEKESNHMLLEQENLTDRQKMIRKTWINQ